MPREASRPTCARGDTRPVTPAQLGVLCDVLSAPDDHLFVERVVCPLRGTLDPAAFHDTWRVLVRRHESLRSGFEERAGGPVQVVHDAAELPVRFLDWSGRGAAAQTWALDALLASEAERGFDLATPPLMRLTLARVAPDRHLLVWTSHHLILDGWSCWVLLAEAAVVYCAAARGAALDLPPAPRFGDYARWLAREDRAAAHGAYWRAYLGGYVVAPGARPAPRGARRFRQQRAVLPAEATRRVAAFGRRTRTTLNTLLQAAWALVLADRREDDAGEVVFGTVFSGRNSGFPNAANMVGMLIGLLPVRVPLPPTMPVGEWLALLQQRHVDMLAHESCTVHEVRRWAGLDRDRPLFDSVVVLMNIDPLDRIPLVGLEMGRPRYLANASHPLGVNVTPGPETTIEMLYDARVFTTADIAELQSQLAVALDLIAGAEATHVGALRAGLRVARRGRVAARREPLVGRLGRVAEG